jgi:hypothetical protein
MFCLLYSLKQKIVKFHAQKQIEKSHIGSCDIAISKKKSIISTISNYMQMRKCNLVNLHVYTSQTVNGTSHGTSQTVNGMSHGTSQKFINNSLSVHESLKIYLQA